MYKCCVCRKPQLERNLVKLKNNTKEDLYLCLPEKSDCANLLQSDFESQLDFLSFSSGLKRGQVLIGLVSEACNAILDVEEKPE